MKNYCFNPHDYDTKYIVMANSKDHAIIHLMYYFQQQIIKGNDYYKSVEKKWVEALKLKIFPDKYTIEEYDGGQIIET